MTTLFTFAQTVNIALHNRQHLNIDKSAATDCQHMFATSSKAAGNRIQLGNDIGLTQFTKVICVINFNFDNFKTVSDNSSR